MNIGQRLNQLEKKVDNQVNDPIKIFSVFFRVIDTAFGVSKNKITIHPEFKITSKDWSMFTKYFSEDKEMFQETESALREIGGFADEV